MIKNESSAASAEEVVDLKTAVRAALSELKIDLVERPLVGAPIYAIDIILARIDQFATMYIERGFKRPESTLSCICPSPSDPNGPRYWDCPRHGQPKMTRSRGVR